MKNLCKLMLIAFVVTLCTLLWTASWFLVGSAAVSALEIGQPIGPVTLETLGGHRLVMDNYDQRHGTVIVFVSSRCKVTQRDIEAINQVHLTYRLRGILFVGVSSHPEEASQELAVLCQRQGVIFPVYRDPDRKVATHLGATRTPEAFLFDNAGVLLYRGPVLPAAAVGGVEAAIDSYRARRDMGASRLEVQGTPLDEVGEPYVAPVRYPPIRFSSELVFEEIEGAPVHHCSTLTETSQGDLLCLWYGGTYESAEDQVLFLARRKRDQRIWETPRVVVQNHGQPPGNAVIFNDGSGRIWIVWGRMESDRPIRRGSGWTQCRLLYRTSEDHGESWSADRLLHDALGWLPRNLPVTLGNGDLALPLSGRVDGSSGSFLLKTSDAGKTWTRSGVVRGGSQPTVIERDDGSLFMLMRSAPRIPQSLSLDGGQTWSAPSRTALKNPGAGIAMTKLQNGHVLLVFNDTVVEPRSPLSIARSTDDGRSWAKPIELESNVGEYSYPCVLQGHDGRIHITYTCRRWSIKHVELSETWLTQFERPD